MSVLVLCDLPSCLFDLGAYIGLSLLIICIVDVFRLCALIGFATQTTSTANNSSITKCERDITCRYAASQACHMVEAMADEVSARNSTLNRNGAALHINAWFGGCYGQ
jgi:hypothetical protein